MQTLIETEEKPLGVIESLQQGFNFLNKHLWLMLLPVLLDLILWLSPRVTLAPLVEQFLAIATDPSQLPSDFATNYQLAEETLRTLGNDFNLLSLLAGWLTGMPSLLARLDFHSVPSPVSQVVSLQSWEAVLVAMLVLLPVGIAVGSLWLTMMVFAFTRRPWSTKAFLGRWGWIWLNVNLYFLLLMVAMLFASLFFGMLLLIAQALGTAGVLLISFLWLLFIGLVIWLSIGLYFVVISVALDGVNLARAIWRSLNVVGRNALSTLGFLILMVVLTEGFARIWARLSQQEWGVVLSILGNAYLGTALMAAAFIYYQSRYHHWQKNRALVILTKSEPPSSADSPNSTSNSSPSDYGEK